MAPRPINPIVAMIADAERRNALATSLIAPEPKEWEMAEQTGLD